MDNSEILFKTKYLQLKEAPSPSGAPWYYAHRDNVLGVVVIVPVINNTYTVFLETSRPPIYAEGLAQSCIELPAGLVGDIDKEESFWEAAHKELLEETGYHAESIELCAQNCCSSPGCTSETFSILKAHIADDFVNEDALTSDGGVIVARHKVALSEVRTWLAAQEKLGKSVSAQTYAGMFFILR